MVPGIGLSVLFHVIVIAGGILLSALFGRRYQTALMWPGLPTFLNGLVIGATFIVVMVSVYGMVQSVVFQDDSVVSMISRYLTEETEGPVPGTIVYGNVLLVANDECYDLLEFMHNYHDGSLTDYLSTHKQPHALEDRRLLAQKLGMESYSRNASDDSRLLRFLIVEEVLQSPTTHVCRKFSDS